MGLEWGRLLLHLEAALAVTAPEWLLPAAVTLFDCALDDGWLPTAPRASATPPIGG